MQPNSKMKRYFVLGLTSLVLAAMTLAPSSARRVQKTDAQPGTSSVVGRSSTLMPDGSWLVLGGEGANGPVANAAIKNGSTGTVAALPHELLQVRAWHTATLLPNGTVLIFGGIGSDGQVIATGELFNPVTQEFTAVSMNGPTPRSHHSATLLTDGRVFIAGGISGTGETLDSAEFLDSTSLAGSGQSTGLLIARHDQTATLLPNGEVLIWGGTDSHGESIQFGETFDPAALRFNIDTTPYQVSNDSPVVEFSMPGDHSENVAANTLIALRFSKPLLVTSANAGTLTLAGASGGVAASVVPAEGGMLTFVNPQAPLLPGTNYVLTVAGPTDLSGNALPQTLISFTTAGPAPNSGAIPFAFGGNASGANGIDSRFQKLPPLEAPSGTTALAGQSLQLNGLPVEDLTLTVEDQKITTKTDGTGRFLLKSLSAGHHVLFVDGTTAGKKSTVYGTYEIGVDVKAGLTNVLSYTIWMTELDIAHAATIPSPTTSDTVIGSPLLPGLELHIPSGTVIDSHEGQVVTQISITPIPLSQPPFPLPAGVQVPIYFTIQPGAAYLKGSQGSYPGAQLYYPNTYNAPAGARYDFWNYDPDVKGWYVYGQGTVSANRSQIIPDPGVKIHEFTGAMVATQSFAPATSPRGASGGDPVDLSSGLFVYRKTDLTLADVIPIALTRTYRPADSRSRAFGIGTTHLYDMFLVGDTNPYTFQELILPDGQRIRYNRTSSGTDYISAVYIHSSTGSMFYGSTIHWNGAGWTLTLKDGTVYVFPDGSFTTSPQQAALLSITDRNGNEVTLTRDSSKNLTKINSPNGRSITLTYDTSNRITQAQDSIGRTVSYTYDGSGRLSTVTDANSGTTTYTYDSNNNMLTITDPRGILYLTNQYDSNNRVTQQTLADGTTYQFSWTLSSYTTEDHFVVDGSGYTGAGPGLDISGFRACSGCEEGYRPLISQVNVTDQRGHVRKVVFGDMGYITSDTGAYGETGAQTTTYQYFPDDLLESTTDALSRTTAYVYDTNDNLTQVTQLSGTGNAVSTSFTYESSHNQLASVTDPLSHTTSFGHDSSGNLTSVTDPLSHATTFTNNSAGQPLTVTDPLTHTTTFGYDFGDLVSITDPLGRTTTRFVDAAGRLMSVTDPLGELTRYAYDPLNEVTSVTDPQGNATTFSYDGNGNLLSVTDANSHATNYAYDYLDRLAARTDPLGNSESYGYDAAGNLTSFVDRRGKITSYTYDNLSRRTFAGFGTTSGPSYESSITYNYDAGNRFSSVVDSVAGTITPTFDGLNRLTQEVSTQGTVSYAYDAASRRTGQTVTGQTAMAYTYDNANRLTQITRGTPTVSLAYDNANRRTSVTLPNGVVMSYGYDNGSELTGITDTNGGTTLGTLTYAYDLAGRHTSLGGSYAATGLPMPVSSASYNANNQLTQWGTASLYYDSNGNMTSDGSNSLAWNARSQLASMNFSSDSFQYDAYGRRTGKTISSSTTNYLYDGANVVQELSGGSPTANLLSGGIDEVFTRTDSSGTANFLTDGLGSTAALTDGSASMLASYAYEPFGNTTVTSGSSANPYQYTGRENDGTGVYFDRSRYYSPTLQRFVSEDPILLASGDLNFYAYAYNDPMRYRDPSGRDPVIGIWVGAIAGGFYGGLGAWTEGGSLGDVLIGAGVGAGMGALVGLADPTAGVGTAMLIGGTAGGAGDLLGQWIGGVGSPCKPFNWGHAAGAVAGGALGGWGGAQMAAAEGWIMQGGVASITAGPAVLLPGIGGNLLPPNTAQKCGCQ
jgi:RHS repeat-associated protein